MLLKRLEIHGFKSFASRTVFEFQSGITAIVGPNGSGKSNIADAVRWVLGEQSSRAIRTKKTDDAIFAGSANRPSMGMAEVSLTLDNADGQLDLEFGEVTITRRVYRSGENEYLLNRRRVRLRDIVELLLKANVGQNAYTVIGQGLVDAALSLRPEERRALLEEAAAVKRYHLKMEEARDRLSATERNLARVSDILQEIEPRLSYAERQAKSARLHDTLAHELALIHQLWYGDQWLRTQKSLAAAVELLRASETAAHLKTSNLANTTTALERVRAERARAAGEAKQCEQRCSSLTVEIEGLGTRIAAGEQRRRFIAEQAQEAMTEVEGLRAVETAEAQAAHDARERVQELAEETATQTKVLDELKRMGADLEARLHRARQALESARKASLRQATDLAAARNQLAHLDEREGEIDGEIGRQVQEKERLRDRLAESQEYLTVLTQKVSTLKTHRAEIGERRQSMEKARQRDESRADELNEQLAKLAREKHQLITHLEALDRLQSNFAGIYDGVRAVLQASAESPARIPESDTTRSGSLDGEIGPMGKGAGPERQSGRLQGIIGIVASLVQVPKELDIAIEAALGGHLQDIVVENWQDAEEAIAYLKRSRRGRATFLPLDTVRRTPPAAVPAGPGILGLASQLIEFAPRFETVIEQLLGRTVVVRELEGARQLLAGRTSFSQIVTLEGEIVRPTGAVTGGSLRNGQDSGMLGRVRERRKLEAELKSVDEQGDILSRQVQAIRQQVESQRLAEKPLGEAIASLEGQTREIDKEVTRAEQAIQQTNRELSWIENLTSRITSERAALGQKREDLRTEVARLQEIERDQQAQVNALQNQGQEIEELRTANQEGLAQAKAHLSVIDRAKSDEVRLLADHEAALRRVQDQLRARLSRAKSCEDELTQLASANGRLEQELSEKRRQVAAAELARGPALEAVGRLDEEERQLQAAEMALRDELLAMERERAKAEVERQRAQDEVQRIEERMQGEGIAPPPTGDGWAEKAVQVLRNELGLKPAFSNGESKGGVSTQVATADSDELAPVSSGCGGLAPGGVFSAGEVESLRRRSDRLEAQLRHLGPVNPEAVREHEELRERQTFLSTQGHDLRAASASLQEAIASLERLVKQQFDDTFRAVGTEFRRYFTALFGGGSARLTIEEPDESRPQGVEIAAQPPGKRVQNLTLLSGGERALTAGALLLAILNTNPVPFCVMDEVDAALDDVNVGRFTRELQALSEKTQFILITHNKGTIEVANTIYGISLGSDNASRVISLRLPG